VVALILGDGPLAAARLGVYRNHVFSTLTDALERLSGRLPPRGPTVFAYAVDGTSVRARLPAVPLRVRRVPSRFLRRVSAVPAPPVPPGRRAAGVAITAHCHAEARSPFDPTRLRGSRPTAPRGSRSGCTLGVVPRSRWPVDRVWRANQPGADPDAVVDLDAGGCGSKSVGSRRRGVPIARAATYAFRSALAAGGDSAGNGGGAGRRSEFDLTQLCASSRRRARRGLERATLKEGACKRLRARGADRHDHRRPRALPRCPSSRCCSAGGRERFVKAGLTKIGELGADRPRSPTSTTCRWSRPRSPQRIGTTFELAARAPHRGPRDAARDLAADRDDPDDPVFVYPAPIGAPHLGLDFPDLLLTRGCGRGRSTTARLEPRESTSR